MARATWVQTNFNGGEWSPLAYGRFDLAKYKNGLALCQNWLPQQQGGLTRRPGTRFITYAKSNANPVRLQPFQFSITQAYMLEFGDYYIRIYANDAPLLATSQAAYNAGTAYVQGNLVTQGAIVYVCLAATTGNAPPNATYWYALTGTILELPTPFSAAEVWGLSFTQSADTLFIAHANHPPCKFQRVSADNWRLVGISFLDGPYLSTNVTTTSMTPSSLTGTATIILSSNAGINGGAGFRASDVGRSLRLLVNGLWQWGTITSVNGLGQPVVAWANSAQTPTVAVGLAYLVSGKVNSITLLNGGAGYGLTAPSIDIEGGGGSGAAAYALLVNGSVSQIVVTNAGSGYTSAPTVLISHPDGSPVFLGQISGGSVVGSYGTGASPLPYLAAPSVTVVGGGGAGALATCTISNGVVNSISISPGGTGYTTTPLFNFSAPPPGPIYPTTFWRLGLWNATDGYPSAVTFHQDRLCWAGAANSPSRVDCSNSGDYENMAPTYQDGTVADNSGLSFTLNSGSVNAIEWMKSDQWGLLIGTAGSEWAVSPSSTQQALSPTNINAMEMSNFGSAANFPPLRVGRATLFLQRTGRKVREMTYQFMVQTFKAADISLVGEHLTKGGMKQAALQLAPQQVVWFATNPGVLVGMTYDADQEVCGWHWHTLGGFSDAAQTLPPVVESVASIPAPGILRDEVWLSVQRNINGATVRTIEVMAKLWEDGDTTPHCCYLDLSTQIVNAGPSTVVSGLTWLEGQTVGVLTDGAQHQDCTVTGGALTLQWPATIVQVGLPFASNGQSLSIEAGGTDGPAQGKLKRVFKTVLRFFQSIGLSMGSDVQDVEFYPEPFRTPQDLMDNPISLNTGDQIWPYEGTWDVDGKVSFSATGPLPANITMLMAQLDTEEAQ